MLFVSSTQMNPTAKDRGGINKLHQLTKKSMLIKSFFCTNEGRRKRNLHKQMGLTHSRKIPTSFTLSDKKMKIWDQPGEENRPLVRKNIS